MVNICLAFSNGSLFSNYSSITPSLATLPIIFFSLIYKITVESLSSTLASLSLALTEQIQLREKSGRPDFYLYLALLGNLPKQSEAFNFWAFGRGPARPCALLPLLVSFAASLLFSLFYEVKCKII